MEKIHRGRTLLLDSKIFSIVSRNHTHNSDGKAMQHNMTTCAKQAKQAKQKKGLFMPTDLPDYLWQVVGTDLFEIKGIHFLIAVDYFSRYPEVTKLISTTSLKAVFFRHALPEVVGSDDGPQFSSYDFSRFADTYNFNHVTSSPFYPQSNGQAERPVQTVKGILQKSTDHFMALLSYGSTHMPCCVLSPSELCMEGVSGYLSIRL